MSWTLLYACMFSSCLVTYFKKSLNISILNCLSKSGFEYRKFTQMLLEVIHTSLEQVIQTSVSTGDSTIDSTSDTHISITAVEATEETCP